MKNLFISFILFISYTLFGQQNQQLYLMHYLGESNFLNPAVQSECKWFIGLPVISSIHINYANSAFSYKQLIKSSGDGSYYADIDGVVDHLGRRSFLGTEFHTSLLALGYKRNEYYFAFSVIEKINLPFTLPRNAISLLWKGNTQSEGSETRLNGLATYFTYYREYALGISKQNINGNYLGLKGKLLFGKLNLSTPKTDASLYTDGDYFNLVFDGEIKVNMSAPVIINHENGRITSGNYDNNVSLMNLLFNRKNWGIAFDLGFIHNYSSRFVISGSILDLGFIRWRSNLNNLFTEGQFHFEGIPVDSTLSANFYDNLIDAFSDTLQIEVTNNPYTTFLPTKLYLAGNYEINNKLKAGGVLSGVIYRSKLLTAATITGDYNFFRNIHVLASYSLMYRSYTNVGFGLSMGRGPLQFYAISDNILGIIWPLSARNINLRFGLNINLGCTSNQKSHEQGRSTPGQVPCPTFNKNDLRRQGKLGKTNYKRR